MTLSVNCQSFVLTFALTLLIAYSFVALLSRPFPHIDIYFIYSISGHYWINSSAEWRWREYNKQSKRKRKPTTHTHAHAHTHWCEIVSFPLIDHFPFVRFSTDIRFFFADVVVAVTAIVVGMGFPFKRGLFTFDLDSFILWLCLPVLFYIWMSMCLIVCACDVPCTRARVCVCLFDVRLCDFWLLFIGNLHKSVPSLLWVAVVPLLLICLIIVHTRHAFFLDSSSSSSAPPPPSYFFVCSFLFFSKKFQIVCVGLFCLSLFSMAILFVIVSSCCRSLNRTSVYSLFSEMSYGIVLILAHGYTVHSFTHTCQQAHSHALRTHTDAQIQSLHCQPYVLSYSFNSDRS